MIFRNDVKEPNAVEYQLLSSILKVLNTLTVIILLDEIILYNCQLIARIAITRLLFFFQTSVIHYLHQFLTNILVG